MTAREGEIRHFLEQAGYGASTRMSLAGDASNRRYERLLNPDGARAVLMDAPPAKGEDVRPFVQIATHLSGVGLSAPQVLAQDTELGLLVLEDLGDDLFARVVILDPALEDTLYSAAIDVLTALHATPAPALKPYDAATTAPLAALAFDWYLFGISGTQDNAMRQAFLTDMEQCLVSLDNAKPVMIQRDYHAENLLWLPERTGAARVGLLDFQDAMLGHPAYDLVSLLQDARRDVPAALEARMVLRFVDQNRQSPDDFAHAYAVMGLQRNLRILGVFARLCLRDGKPHYIDLLPRVWAHIETNLRHPALTGITEKITRDLPAPTPENLNILRSKCATCPDR